jgi:hypothetical protein
MGGVFGFGWNNRINEEPERVWLFCFVSRAVAASRTDCRRRDA